METKILDELKKSELLSLIAEGKRKDGRKFDEYRKITVEKGVIQNAEGSALAKIGKTQVLCGVKFGVSIPYPDSPKEGTMMVMAELLPSASHLFEPGPPGEESIELARVVDRGIRSAEIMDFSSFFIEEGKVLSVFIDLYVLDHDGDLIDASALASMAALLDAKMPLIEEGAIVRGKSAGPLPLKEKVVTCTFAKVGDHFLLDTTLDEEAGVEGRFSIATTPTHVCGIQKGGSGAFSKKNILELVDLSFKKGEELRALL